MAFSRVRIFSTNFTGLGGFSAMTTAFRINSAGSASISALVA